jgi:septal ring factor EnvC (AmiA/AmiB activator)
MIKVRRGSMEASVSFLDVISCGFGAIVLLLIIAPVGDPAALEEAEQGLKAVVQEMTESLLEIRGESVVLNRDLQSRKEQLSDLEERVARLKAQLASVDRQSDEVAQSKIVEEEQLRLALQVLTEEMERLAPQDHIKT